MAKQTTKWNRPLHISNSLFRSDHMIQWSAKSRRTHPRQDGLDAVLVSGQSPEEHAAGGAHGRAVVGLLGQHLSQLTHLGLQTHTTPPLHTHTHTHTHTQ